MKIAFTLDKYFELQKNEIWFGLVFESLAHEEDMHVCYFFLYLLICILDLFV